MLLVDLRLLLPVILVDQVPQWLHQVDQRQAILLLLQAVLALVVDLVRQLLHRVD